MKLPPDEYLDFINGLCGIDFIDDKSTLVHVMSYAISQQAITWANADPDLCCHMVSPDHNDQ